MYFRYFNSFICKASKFEDAPERVWMLSGVYHLSSLGQFIPYSALQNPHSSSQIIYNWEHN